MSTSPLSGLSIDDSAQRFNGPLQDLQDRYPGKRLVVGVAIIRNALAEEGSPKKKLLILQRAETEDVYPLMYEIPGGGCEPEDSSLIATVIRETAEETGLKVHRITGIFPGFEYETSKSKAIQFNFMAEVETGTDVQLNPCEHCAFAWIDVSDDLSGYPMTANMLQVVKDALAAITESSP
ncbi:hypothetical protein CVT26_009094 [Gymnopilus dilepis]|uniref:Nudix hydrolase domain-containing protein n=1 Tax=Gymnopilus dilepis TaxID=231916 RepID=A0A409WCE8_9AGAR|nr:hypothetical protein CVT26_009094 [Gymnopilus dilepis]